MFKEMRYKYRILSACCAPLVLIIIMAVVIYANLKVVQRSTGDVYEAQSALYDVKQMQLLTSTLARNFRGYLLSRDKTFIERFEENSKNLHGAIKDAEEHLATQEQRERIKGVQAMVAGVVETDARLLALASKGMQAEAIRQFAAGKVYLQVRKIDDAISEFEKVEKDRMQVLQDEEAGAINSIINTLVAGTVITIALAVGLSLFLASRLSMAISSPVAVLSTSSAEMAATVTEQEKAASTQASMVSQMSATVSELGSSSQKTAEQATSSAETARQVSTKTEEGQAAVKEAVGGMGDLKKKVSAIADSILRLGDQIAQIGSIAEMVKDIATQTNMLALNAAVEAVRAGEHGKGFAVLASEVRKLADQSKRSAEDARAIVAEIQKTTNSTIMVTEEGTKTVEKVTTLAGQVGELFERLSEAAGLVYDNAQQVLLNARQQSSAVGQVVEAVNAINAGSREAAAGLTQTRTGIQNLNRAAEDLKAVI